MALDGSGNLYVADLQNFRINKFVASTGAFVGWIGSVGTVPTGGAAGCTTALVGTTTPGWCTGGASQSGTGNGMFSNLTSITIDSGGTLYATDYYRVQKFTASTGVFGGWIGKIQTSPTGGAAGCNGATSGNFTPGWCLGGTATLGSGDGMLSTAQGIFADSGGSLYVADSGNGRISKYTASTGAFVGWIGNVGVSPTGGAAGCNGAAIDTVTPGWCKGGSASQKDGGSGQLNGPAGVFADTGGNLYVSSSNNGMVAKYNAGTGAFIGWIGKIGSSPTGGDPGCNGAAVGALTPGWCVGGSSDGGTSLGMLRVPVGIYVDSSGNLYIADTYDSRINKYTASTGAPLGALGIISTFQPWNTTSLTSGAGVGDGMMNAAYGLRAEKSGYLYVADTLNARVNKYVTSTGAFVGWIGKIQTSPTGGAAGCNGAAIGAATPGWCTGGTSTGGTDDGMFGNTFDVVEDSSGYLYVSDFTNHRVMKFIASTGAFVGWIGAVNTSPTGGAAGCAGASAGTFTPGWCTGGTSAAGTGDGMLTTPTGLSIDSSGYLYVGEGGGHRISKYVASTGAFVGWVGKIATSPTGGAAGCAGAAVGSLTPGWCKGGTAAQGAGSGELDTIYGLTLDTSGNVFVADGVNHRVNKYNASTGIFLGWIGAINTPPTGGAAGCNGASAGTVTPGWCTGGDSTLGAGDGMFNNPAGISTDNRGHLYVADMFNSRINKYQSSTGAFLGWIGGIGTSPTDGARGCKGAAVGTVTPGWCKGGATTTGPTNGMFNFVIGLSVAPNGEVFGTDYSLSRVIRFKPGH